MKRHDWTALRAEFISRRLEPDSTLTLAEFGREKGLSQRSLERNSKGWLEEVEAASIEASNRALDSTMLDVVAIRLKLLARAGEVDSTFQREHAKFNKRRALRETDPEKAAQLDKTDPILSVSDLRKLEQMEKELYIEGGGLPKEHVVRVDDNRDEIILNREQQRELSRIAQGWRKYGEKHGVRKLLGLEEGTDDDEGPGEGEADKLDS